MNENGEPDQHKIPSHPSVLFSEGFALLRPEHLEEGVGDVLANEYTEGWV